MKFSVPKFLRKSWQSSSNPSSLKSLKGVHLSQPVSRPEVSDSSAIVSSSIYTSSSSPSESSSEGSWKNGLEREQKMSSTKGILVSKHPSEAIGKAESQFHARLPALGPHQELEEVFMRFDANRDGKISALELGSILRSLGDDPSEEELLSMVKEADRDGDGFIDLEDFVLLNATDSTGEVDVLREAFSIFDADEDGKISVMELHCVLSRLGDVRTTEECIRMIQGVDKDGDGFVDFEEFCCMMGTHEGSQL